MQSYSTDLARGDELRDDDDGGTSMWLSGTEVRHAGGIKPPSHCYLEGEVNRGLGPVTLLLNLKIKFKLK